MAKILLDYYNGHYSTLPLSDEEATTLKLEAGGGKVIHVDDRVLEAWNRHCAAEVTWQALWRAILNEQHGQRAEHEISRRKNELDVCQQVEHDHWEGKLICGNTLPCVHHGGR